MTTTFYSKIETRRCSHCGYKGEIEVPNAGLFKRNSGALIQEAFPDLSKELREQLMTGTHPECWAEMFG